MTGTSKKQSLKVGGVKQLLVDNKSKSQVGLIDLESDDAAIHHYILNCYENKLYAMPKYFARLTAGDRHEAINRISKIAKGQVERRYGKVTDVEVMDDEFIMVSYYSSRLNMEVTVPFHLRIDRHHPMYGPVFRYATLEPPPSVCCIL